MVYINLLSLDPDVVIGVYDHHDGPEAPAGLEQEHPAAVEEQKHSEQELDAVTEGADPVDPVVKRLPGLALNSRQWDNVLFKPVMEKISDKKIEDIGK